MTTYLILIFSSPSDEYTRSSLDFASLQQHLQDTLDYTGHEEEGGEVRAFHHVEPDAIEVRHDHDADLLDVASHEPVPVATCMIDADDKDDLLRKLRDHPEYAPRLGYRIRCYALKTVASIRDRDRAGRHA